MAISTKVNFDEYKEILDDIGLKGAVRNMTVAYMQRIARDVGDISPECLQCMAGCYADGVKDALKLR